MKRVRVGNGCGFWGDNIDAPILLAEGGRLDYLTLEYLAELTMSILAHQKQRDPQAGYATDFLDVLERLGPILKAQPGLKVITNAGGMNPASCAARARELLDKAGLSERRIGIVSGDDLMPRLDALLAEGHALANLDTGEPLSSVRSRLVSANAYLGARPIVEALRQSASVVITGRVADASLTLAPAVHELGWKWDDWDRLCAGTVAGHLIECGAQATGGLWINWNEAPDLANVGYPIAEIEEGGTLRITKPEGTGGAVNVETVSEQLLYEVGDPAAYLTPDVVADFTTVTLREVGRDVVQIEGARGKPATDSYKVSCAYRDGWTASGTLLIYGQFAQDKARRCGEMILERLRRAGVELQHSNIEALGAKDLTPEVVLRVTVRDSRREAVERFTKELAPLVTSGPPGVTGYTGGRPPVREVFAYWPALVAKNAVTPALCLKQGIHMIGVVVPLGFLAHGRSGDKGNHANIAVIAYTPAGYDWLLANLTAECVADYFAHPEPSSVVRYEAPNLLALNFVLYDVLAGGASRSLRIDTQGKTLALAMLAMPIGSPDNLLEMQRPRVRNKS